MRRKLLINISFGPNFVLDSVIIKNNEYFIKVIAKLG